MEKTLTIFICIYQNVYIPLVNQLTIKLSKMKITINLSEAEVKGIKQYLKEVGDINNPTKENIKMFINGFVQAIHAPHESVSNYINQYQK